MANYTTGYGLRHKHCFNSDQFKYELWEIKFLGYKKNPKLHKIILIPYDHPNDKDYCEKNAKVFAKLIQYLNDRSWFPIMREDSDNGRKVL